MDITSLSGEQLLVAENLEAIKKEVDLVLQKKDVAKAWQVARHIKTQLALVPVEKVTPVLNDYRRLTSILKILSLPLLSWDEVKILVSKNISFVEEKYIPILTAALPVWLTALDDNEKEAKRTELLNLLPLDSQLRQGLMPVPHMPVSVVIKKTTDINHGDFFDKHEVAELDNHVKKINNIGGAPLAHDGATVAENIYKLAGAQSDKETWLRRANALIASRLRDVRTKNDLREYLQRPLAVGGLGLGGEKLEQAAKLIEDEYNKLHNSLLPVKPLASAPRPEEALTPVPEVELPKIEKIPEPIVPKIEEKIDLPIIEKKTESVLPKPKEPVIEPKSKIELKPESEIPDILAASRPIRPARVAPVNDKPRVDDVRPMMRPTIHTATSADELKFLTLADWRKYKNSEAAVNAIFQKINTLDQVGAVTRMRNIKLFHESQLFKQYVALGQAILVGGIKLAESLSDKNINPNGFTEEEFSSIALLNSRLK